MTQLCSRAKGPSVESREYGLVMKQWFRALAVVVAVQAVQASEPLSGEVRETAGIQRFGYRMEGRFRAPEGADSASRFRLYDGQRPLPAQFSQLEKADTSQPGLWAVNFNIDLLPNQLRTLTLATADDSPPSE